MCRMMGVVSPTAIDASLFTRFRLEATIGRVFRNGTPGHGDGWGIVYADGGDRPTYAGRSARSAATDEAYPEAVARLAKARPRVAIAHFRKATVGNVTVENSHPFVREGLAFCHNGTVHGIAKPGGSDSQAIFEAILSEIADDASPAAAIEATARAIDAGSTYSSLTLLLTDGRALWGLRRVGNDPVACAPEACADEYYTLGYSRIGDALVVSQEHEFLGLDAAAWTPVPDGHLIEVAPGGQVSVRRVF